MKLKKINLRQPKYIFPLVILLPLIFLGYTISQFFTGSNKGQTGVVTDSINMSLPDARTNGMDDKMSAMNKNFSDYGAFTAVDGIGEEKESKDSTESGYTEAEKDAIDRQNAERQLQQQQQEDLQRSLEESRKHINSYSNGGSSQQSDLNDYARELEAIQNRSMERQRRYYAEQDRKDREEEDEEKRQQQEMIDALTGKTKRNKKPEQKTEIVEKVIDVNSKNFNTITNSSDNVDAPLIKAMIDKTTKAREGTRLRFKLLDDVTVKGLKLRKGSYLYGTVTGFGQQRVKATITSILVGNKFIKVSLSVYDNDGMEGFYVPESAFRDMVKEAGGNVAGQNIQFETGYGLSGEALALQALQNMYQSASSAVSRNIRRNKARIKYNTIVYLINTD